MDGEGAHLEVRETRARALAAVVVAFHSNLPDPPANPARAFTPPGQPLLARSRGAASGTPFALTALKWMGIAAAVAAPWILLLTS
jgi:hypothetical protein